MEATTGGIRRRVRFTVDDSLRKRFASKVIQRTEPECWPWMGAMRNGYGAIKHRGRVLGAHVVAHAIAHGVLPRDGQLVCHTCDNRQCVNPSHLYVGTYVDNVHDADKRRTIPRPHGEQVYNAVMTDDMCRLVFALSIVRHIGPWVIASTLGYHKRTIEKVLSRQTWKHVQVPSDAEAAEIIMRWEQQKRVAGQKE